MEEPPVVAIRSEGWNDFVNDLRRRPSELLPVFAKGIKITGPGDSNQKRLRSALEREPASAACDKVSETKKGVWLEQRSTRR